MANVRNDTISIDFDHYLDIKQNITLFLSPFTAFTFSGQSAYSSVFGGEAPFCFFMYCAKAPYERCVQIV